MTRVRIIALAFTIEEIERALSVAGIPVAKQDEIIGLLLQEEGREITYDEERHERDQTPADNGESF